jgi:hypothetical protein
MSKKLESGFLNKHVVNGVEVQVFPSTCVRSIRYWGEFTTYDQGLMTPMLDSPEEVIDFIQIYLDDTLKSKIVDISKRRKKSRDRSH